MTDPTTSTLTLNSGETALVDEDDLELAAAHAPWYASRGLSTTYATTSRQNKTLYLHRLLLDPGDGLEVDHINSNGLDNRRANLRVGTHQQNLRNMRPNGGASPYKGVCWVRRDSKWKAQGKDRDGKQTHLGYYNCEIEAARAYDKFAEERDAEFAWLNRDHFIVVAQHDRPFLNWNATA